MIALLKMFVSGKIFDRICLKAVRDTFFPPQYIEFDQETGGLNFLVVVISNRKAKFKLVSLLRDPLNFPSLVGHPDLPIRKTLRRVLDLLTIMILKKVSESIFFQINIFTACKFKDKKEVTNFLMVFNLLKIIHPFQGKKDLKT